MPEVGASERVCIARQIKTCSGTRKSIATLRHATGNAARDRKIRRFCSKKWSLTYAPSRVARPLRGHITYGNDWISDVHFRMSIYLLVLMPDNDNEASVVGLYPTSFNNFKWSFSFIASWMVGRILHTITRQTSRAQHLRGRSAQRKSCKFDVNVRVG